MPRTAAVFLIGSVAIVGLPPLNGFVSEWLVFRSLVRAGLATTDLRMAVLAGASLGLIGALALACFAKVVGIIYLGVPRFDLNTTIRESPAGMLRPQFALAAACIAIGFLPVLALPPVLRASALIAHLPADITVVDSAVRTLTVLALVVGFALLIGWLLHGRLMRRVLPAVAGTWACAYPNQTPRMQYTASSFAAPLLVAYQPVAGIQTHRTSDTFETHAGDPVLTMLLRPGWWRVRSLARRIRPIQRGRLSAYLMYIVLTLIALMLYLLVEESTVNWYALATFALVLLVAPAMSGIVVKTKALLSGRKGAPVLQLYYDIAKLFRKGTVYSTTTTWVFRSGPIVLLVSIVAALVFLPLDGRSALVQFEGDMIAFAALLALGRFVLVLAGLDTGSSFEGMGASREVTFASFAEPALYLCFIGLALATDELSLSGMLGSSIGGAWRQAAAPLVLLGLSLLILLLAENSRVPVDDPATHLELTMIHEVMVLDHSGPDLAIILYASSIKLALFAALVVAVFSPRGSFGQVAAIAVLLGGLVLVGVAVGVVESVMAPASHARASALVGAGALALFAIILLLR
jgi:formate hydrogenlyase subunit 4